MRRTPTMAPLSAARSSGRWTVSRGGQTASRAAELRCSGRAERLRCSHRCHAACMDRYAAPHSAAPLRGPARSAPSASGRPWPSPFSRLLRSGIARLLPRVCACRLTPARRALPAGVRRVRWSCTPRTPAAPLMACSPHPRIARIVCALWVGSRARSRGYRRPRDITRNYAAHLLCVQARHAPSMAHEIPRPRNSSLCHMAASASLRLLSCRAPGAALPQLLHALRASARHPWLARLVAACRGCARGHRRGSGKSVAARQKAKSDHQAEANSRARPAA